MLTHSHRLSFVTDLLDGLRDLLIADETARLILRTDFGLGEKGWTSRPGSIQVGASTAARKSSRNVEGASEATANICRRDALRRFYNGERPEVGKHRQWRKGAATACKPLTQRQFNWVMRSVDPDQSGDLSRYELTVLLLGSERSLGEKKKQHQRQLRSHAGAALARQAAISEGMAIDEKIADYRRIFHQADTDKSGEISWLEMQVVLERVTSIKHSEKEVKEMIAAIDEDGSGDVDFSEFLLLMAESLQDKELAAAAAVEASSRNHTHALWKIARTYAEDAIEDLRKKKGQAADTNVAADQGPDTVADAADVETGQVLDTKPARNIEEGAPVCP